MKSRFTGNYRRLLIGLLLAAGCCGRQQPAEAYTVRPDHPRIWLTPEVLARLKASAAANTPQWQAIKNNCDSYMTSTSNYDTSIENMALVYRITGNPAYADRAIVLMQGLVDGHQGTAIERDSGYDVRYLLPDLALGYDWCYDRLTPDQRLTFRTALEQWADWVWPETNPVRDSGWSVHNPGDNYYHGFMMTWMAGLALYGDSPKAQGYIDHALNRWNTEVLPYLLKYDAGGYLLEGTNYGTETSFRIFYYLSAHSTATDQDLLTAPGFNWPAQVIRAKLYITTPSLDRMFPGGDQSRVPSAPLSDYARSSALQALNYLDNETAGDARWWLDHINPNHDEWRWQLWEDFLWYRSDRPTIDYTKTLPTGYISPGSGWMTSRSDWSTDATQVYMMCGPSKESHQDLAENDFMIFHHDWMAATARLTSHDGLFRETEFHNVILVGGKGQPENRSDLPKELPHVVHFEDTPTYGYLAGEAHDAYAYFQWPNAVQILNQFYRQLVFVKPNRVIVFDQVDAIDASQEKKWLLQMEQEPAINANTYQTTLGDTTMFGTTVLPKGAAIQKVPLNLATGNVLSSWRLEITAPTGNNLDNFLNVLEIGPASQKTGTPALSIQTGRDTLTGVQIGNQIVVFDTASPAASSVSYHLSATSAPDQLVLDQTPQTWYVVNEMDATGAVAHQQQVQASPQGVLAFQLVGTGDETIVIQPASSTGGSSASGSAAGSGTGTGQPSGTVVTPPPPTGTPAGTVVTPPLPTGTPTGTGGSTPPSTAPGSSSSPPSGSSSSGTGGDQSSGSSSNLPPDVPPLVPAVSGTWANILPLRWWWVSPSGQRGVW